MTDPGVYGMRHFVENQFAALNEFRGVTTRYGQRALLYSRMLNLAATLVAFGEAASRRPAGGHPAVNRRLAL